MDLTKQHELSHEIPPMLEAVGKIREMYVLVQWHPEVSQLLNVAASVKLPGQAHCIYPRLPRI
ncbi:MAG TPA: hypothetical protein VI750_08035 [Pyrinomonadaceae bacterium]|nr:hypothetical protein [Pyrinomonadaceae bacterium]